MNKSKILILLIVGICVLLSLAFVTQYFSSSNKNATASIFVKFTSCNDDTDINKGYNPSNFSISEFRIDATTHKVYEITTHNDNGRVTKSLRELEDCVIANPRNWKCGGTTDITIGTTSRLDQFIDGQFEHQRASLLRLPTPYCNYKYELIKSN